MTEKNIILFEKRSKKMEERDMIINFLLTRLLQEHLISEDVCNETKRRLLAEEQLSAGRVSDAA